MIVVTGAAGFIGKHLVRHLLGTSADRVIGIDNLSRGSWQGLDSSGRLTLLTGDIRDRDLLDRVFPDAEVIFHLASLSNVMGAVANPHESFSSNVVGTFNLLSAAKDAGVRRVVFASSREAYGEPTKLPVSETMPLSPKNAYGASKAACEAYCQAFSSAKTQIAVLRLTNVYGLGDSDRVIPNFIRKALAGESLVIYGTGKLIDFVPVSLVVEALRRAASHRVDEPVNVGSGRGTSLPDLAQTIIDETHSTSSVRVVDHRAEEVNRFVAKVDRMRKVLGLEPPDDPLSELHAMLASSTAKLPDLPQRSVLVR